MQSESQSQPDYAENLFGHLPEGALFRVEGDEHLWEKRGNTKVRALAPTPQEMEQYQQRMRNWQSSNSANRELYGLLPQDKIPTLPYPSTIHNPIKENALVEVAYIPLQSEIRDDYDRLLRRPTYVKEVPVSLQIMREREEQLLAEKARNNDQSPIFERPTNALRRITDWENVPSGSYFTTTTNPSPESMVYVRMGGTHCESICRYEEWENGLLTAKLERKDVKIEDIQRHGRNGPAPVLVVAALTPDELKRMFEAHHDKRTKEKYKMPEGQAAFEEQRMAELNRFWANVT